jgi:hypothetical protein
MQVWRVLVFPSVHTVFLQLLPLQKLPREVEIDRVFLFLENSISVPSLNRAFAVIIPRDRVGQGNSRAGGVEGDLLRFCFI